MANHTHELFMYRGLVYCNVCGGFGKSKFTRLAKPCQPPKEAGDRVLRAISNGVMPAGITIWPEDDS